VVGAAFAVCIAETFDVERDTHVQTPVVLGERFSSSCGPGYDVSNHKPQRLEASKLGGVVLQVDYGGTGGRIGVAWYIAWYIDWYIAWYARYQWCA
jgi:hypothetical protein